MKELLSPFQVMEEIVKKLNDVYPQHVNKREGSIQFYLKHKSQVLNCYIKADKNKLVLSEGVIEGPTVTLRSGFYDWLDLSARKLNPVWGVITGKLKFKGDTKFFKVLPDKLFLRDFSDKNDPVTKFEKNPSKYWEKPKNILVINASPRAERGYTDFYLRPFLKGLEKKNPFIESVYLYKKKINPCTGCWSCWLKGKGECMHDGKDDFYEIFSKDMRSDLIIYAFPLYASAIPGVLKNYFDRRVRRLYPYMNYGINNVIRHPRRITRLNQSFVAFSVCGFPEDSHFNAVREHFKGISHNSHIAYIAEIFRPAASYFYKNPKYYKNLNEIMKALEKAGENIYEKGKIDRKYRKIIMQKLKDKEEFMIAADDFWERQIENKDYDY